MTPPSTEERRRPGGHNASVLIVDAANVIGSRPDGWWRDRPGAARGFVDRVTAAVAAGRLEAPVVVVLEGAARAGVEEGPLGPGITVVHAPGAGDDAIVAEAGAPDARVVTADRGLRRRIDALGAVAVGPRWLWDRLDA